MGMSRGLRIWRLAAFAAIGWGAFTFVVMNLVSTRDPRYDTLSSYSQTDPGLLSASVLSVAVGSLAVLGCLVASGMPLPRSAQVLLSLWALGLTFAAAFPASYPPHPDPVSGEIHLYACLVAFTSLPGTVLVLLEPLRGTPSRATLVRWLWLGVGVLALFGASFLFVRLDEAGVAGFHTLTELLPIGLTQRLMLVGEVALLLSLLRVARLRAVARPSRATELFPDGGGEFRCVPVQPGHSAGVDEHHRLVGVEPSCGRPLDQRRGRLSGVDGVEHDTLGTAEQP
jgi:hypothetical protein